MKMYGKRVTSEWGIGARAGFAALVMVIGIGFAAAPALAQAKKPAPAATDAKKGEAKGADAAQDEKNKTAWLKLCEKVPAMAEPPKDPKDAKDPKDSKDPKAHKEMSVCLTFHERILSPSGIAFTVVIRQIEGQDKQVLGVMMPLGVVLRTGVLMKFDEGETITLPFTICLPMGCTAEIEATKEIVEKMKKAKQLAVGSMDMSGKTLAFPVPMAGFETTLAGPAADNEKYAEERKRIVLALRDRYIELQKKADEEASKNGGAAAQPGAGDKKAPADKKPK